MTLRPAVLVAPALLALGCATAARRPGADTGVRSGANIPAPTPPRIIPTPARGDAAESVVPPFAADPLVTWGPPPAGMLHAVPPLAYDLRHQRVRVRFDWGRHAVVGTTTLRVAALDTALRSVALDAVGMTISRVTNAAGRRLEHQYDGRVLTVRLPRPLAPRATTELTVAYEAVKPEKGAYFIDRRHVVWTQGETQDNRRWVPTNDRPDDKTTWEIRVVTDTNERALSNGRLAGARRVRDGGRPGIEWRWVQEKPASTYLMSVVTGDYVVITDSAGRTPVHYWTYPDSVEAGRRGFGKTPAAIALFERVTGVAFPWAKYDQSVVPDFTYGGMENVSATTQNDDGILHPAWAEPQKNADALVAHELAHQWYGDLLTTRSWAHVWLNEGFATFMESVFLEHDHGADAGALDRLSLQEQTIEADRRARRPVVYDRWREDPIELFFSGHIYPKGATILYMLRHQLGDSLFWAAMHRYTSAHAYGSVESDDLRAAFEQATGRDFGRFFAQWVYGAGFPAYRVTYHYDAPSRDLTLEATEVQPRDSFTGTFDVDVGVEVLTDSGAVRGVVPMRNGSGRVALALAAAPRSIQWNTGRWVLAITDFPRPTTMLVHQLAHADVLGRAEAVDLLAARAGARAGTRAGAPAAAQPGAVAALVRAATADSAWAIRARALGALANAVTNGDASDAVRAAFATASADADSRVRRAAVAGLARFPGGDTPSRLARLARTDTSLYVRGAALASYLSVAGEAGLSLAEEVMAVPSWGDVLRSPALAVLERMGSPRARALRRRYAPAER